MEKRRVLITLPALILAAAVLAGCSGGRIKDKAEPSQGAPDTSDASAGITAGKPSAETDSLSPTASAAVSTAPGDRLADGSYPVYVTGAETENGKYYLRFKTIAQYDVIPEYLEKVYTAGELIHDEKTGDYYTGDSWDLEKYYDNNYPLIEYKDGKVGQINMQELPGLLGLTKADFLEKIASFTNEDDNVTLYTDVNKGEHACCIRGDCDIEVSGALAKEAPTTDKLTPEELTKRIDQYFENGDLTYLYRVTIALRNGEASAFKEEFHP